MRNFAIICLMLLSTDLFAARVLKIQGFASPWVRECNQKGNCGLPSSIGQKVFFSLLLKENVEKGGVGIASKTVDLGSMLLKIKYYWVSKVAKPEIPKGYISIQQTLFDKTSGKIIAEAGQYRADHDDANVPVGFIAGPIVNGKQLGFSVEKFVPQSGK